MIIVTHLAVAGMRTAGQMRFFSSDYYVTYFLCIAAFIFALICSARVRSTFAKYDRVRSKRAVQAWQVARQILDNNGLYDITVTRTSGSLTDKFDPNARTVYLSDSVYASSSLAAIGVAAHECGHAIQHSKGYLPIKIRSLLVPAAQLGSRAYFIVFFLGLIMNNELFVNAGIILFLFVVLFQLVTLPVEFNASSRAMRTLESELILDSDELPDARRTLSAAAMTYVASLVVSVTQLLRLLARSRGRR